MKTFDESPAGSMTAWSASLPEAKQVELVAEFHAHRIRPSRIAHRLGIDIALVDALLAGDKYPDRFPALVNYYRKRRFHQRVADADGKRGQKAFELRAQAQRDYDLEKGI